MRTFEFSVLIERRPLEVFDFMANPDNEHLWLENLISSEWITPEPADAGSVKRRVFRFMGRELEANVEYTVWDRPHGYDIKSATGPFSFAGATKFEARDNGTVVTFAGQVEGSGILKLAEGLAARQLEKQERRNYDTLKRILGAE